MSGNTVLSRSQTTTDRGAPPDKTGATNEQNAWVERVLGVTLDSPPDVPIASRPTPVDVGVVTAVAQNQALVGNTLLAALPDDDDDVNGLRDALQAHSLCVPKEASVFKYRRMSIEHVDDLPRIAKPEDRQKKVTDIEDVLDAVAERRADLLRAIRAVEAKPNPSEETKAALKLAWTTLTTMSEHLPVYFRDPYVEKELQRRLKTLSATKEEKAALLGKAMQGFVDPDGAPLLDDDGEPVGDGLRDTFKDVIEKIGTRDFDRQNYYFDSVTTAISREDGAKIYAANDHLVEQGQLILDCGGTLRDVQLMLAKTGVPEDWWPPRLVESLQAWRKVERALAEEKMASLIEQKKPDFETTEGIMAFFLSELPELGAAVCEFFEDNEIAKATKELLEAIKNGFDTGAIGFTALQSLDFDELEPTLRQKLLDGLSEKLGLLESALNTACAGLKIAKSAGADHLASVIPGLSIAACGVNLALAIKKLSEHSAIRVQTGLMKNEAFKALGNAEITDGGAFIQTLGNEVHGRNKQITKDGIEVTTSTMDLTGAIVGTFGAHYGLVAQAGLKITSTGITWGTKVVFSNIDWGEADRAKKMLKEARAGNPVARMQIFKESNLYAKMYICTLCRDGSPLALKFVDQRGIEEGDLSTPMSLKILREALLESADQKDENDIDDSVVMENLGKVGKFGKFVASGVKSGVKSGAKAIKEVAKDRKVKYSVIALPYDAATALTEASWDETKRIAIRAGLYDKATGIGDALSDYEKALAKVTPLITAGTRLNPETKDGKAAQADFLIALDALGEAQGALDRCGPTCNPDGKAPHPELAAHVVAMLKTARWKYNVLEQSMSDLGLKDAAWTPGVNGPSLDPGTWETIWKDGIVRACLPDWDGGVLDALKAVAKAEGDIAGATGNTRLRATRLVAVDALNALIIAGKQCWAQARGTQKMLDKVDEVLKAAGARRIELDKALAPDTWAGLPVDPPAAVTAVKWKAFWDKAFEDGMCLGTDCGLFLAVKEMDARWKAAADAASGKPKLKARQDFGIAVGKVIMAEQKLLTTQRDVCTPIKQYVMNIHARALQAQGLLSGMRDEAAFLVVGSATVAGWTQSYANAVDTGAVPACKGGAAAFEKALKAYEAAFAKMQTAVKAKKFEDALKQAILARQGLNVADKAVYQKLQSADGYATNKTMGPYLERLREGIATRLAAPELTAALGGTAAGSSFVATPFTLSSTDFTKTKDAAVKNGVIAETKTGVGGALDKCRKSLKELSETNTASFPDQVKIDKARKVAIADATLLQSVVAKLAGLAPDCAAWKNYAKQADAQAKRHLEDVTKRHN